MPTNDQDIRALKYLAMRLRKETYGAGPWDEHGTHIVFADYLTRMNLGVAMDLVLRHAQDPDAKTPAAIKRKFAPEPPKPDHRWMPPKRDEECPAHPGQRATACGGCRADELAGDTTDRPREAADEPIRTAALEATYAAIAASKSTHTQAAVAAEEEA